MARVALLATLFAVGLALRLPGLLFNGMYDLDEMILSWGTAVANLGIGPAFTKNYGLLSYLAFGSAAEVAEQIPRFWWAPYKAMVVGAEIGVLGALIALVPASLRLAALWMYWLNPWFILHGAWHGFWDAPYVFAALLGVVCLQRIQRQWLAWFGFGAFIATSGMFKPQGLFQIAAPIGIYLVIDFLRRRDAALWWFGAGGLATLVASTAFLVADGADWLVIAHNYIGAAGAMPNLCNECLNVWHPVSALLQTATGQSGHTYQLSLPGPILGGLHLASAVVTLGAIALFSWLLATRQADARRAAPRDRALLLLMAFATLVISSFGTMAHINHGYAALVFAIPLAAASRRFRKPWIALIAIAFVAHAITFGLGRAQVLPDFCVDYMWNVGGCAQQWDTGVVAPPFAEFEQARSLVDAIQRATPRPRALLNVQAWARHLVVSPFADRPIVALLSVGQLLGALALLREYFRSVRDPQPA